MHSAPSSVRSRSPQKSGGARLGGARADFVAGLGRKVADLRAVFQKAKTDADGARAELRRKLGILASGAKMMKFDAMDRGLGEALGTIDRAPVDEPLDAVDLDAIEQLIDDLPALAWGDGMGRTARSGESTPTQTATKHEVLVVGNAQIAEALLGSSGKIAFTCETTPDAATAYDLVRTTEPDLIILDADIPNAIDLVDALMDDPLTETVPIIVVGSFQENGEASRFVAMGVAKTVTKPMTKHALRDVCEETLAPDRGALTAHAVLGDPTLEELGDRLAQEVRDAIVGRADPSSRNRRIALGQGTEVLGAVWGAIARVREVVTSRTDGAIRFAGGPEGALTPALLLHAPELARSDRTQQQKRNAANDVRLEGRRVVVADDDPAVVWFLADLLRTAGCDVLEAFDGRRALELAYETSPDLVISDILMPNLDGFSLCRSLRRDVALRDTPVILLSWKEDLLQRVRELGANAAGYVRKESDTRAIIARVREALRARGRIEARLCEDGEVRGRLDGVSIRTLLETVSVTRPNARVSVRDATFLYEVELRGGAPRRVTRTDSDGGFVKGAKMLTQMLGVGAGRFAVTVSNSPIEAELEGNLSAQLAKPVAKARAAVNLLTGARMNAVARVRFDEGALVDYLKATPEKARLVARRLANGASPRELVLHGGCEAALLDDILCDLAARGLVIAIEGNDGEDMLTPAITALLAHSDTRADIPLRAVTPPPPERQFDVDACSDVASEPICVSPPPAPASAPASLEDAVLRELSHRSPSPEPALANAPMFPFGSPAPMLLDPTGLRLRAPTPSPTFIEAMAESTIVDNTTYGAPLPEDEDDDVYRSEAIVPGAEEEALPQISQQEMTPFSTVTDDSEPAPAAPKKKAWPMLAFITATGVVAWAVLHFSTHSLTLPKLQETQPPPVEMKLPANLADQVRATQDRADEVFYTQLAAETQVAEGEGVIDVLAPPDAVVLVDGKERAKGSATIPAAAGKHAVTVKKGGTSEERDCTIDVRLNRVAHMKF